MFLPGLHHSKGLKQNLQLKTGELLVRELFQHCGQRSPQEDRLWGFHTAQTQEEQVGEKRGRGKAQSEKMPAASIKY